MAFTDIRRTIWIERLPAHWRPYAYLARLDRPVGVWLLLLPGWWAILLASGGLAHMDGRAWWIFVLFGLGALVMRAAGCIINDLWDRNLDRRVERTRGRPLASGTLSVRQALIFLLVLLLAGLLILLQMNRPAIILGFLTLPLIFIYPLMKRFTWWPQAFLGLTFNFGTLIGWSAVTGTLEMPAFLLYVAGIFWTLGYDTIYAYQDREDDALAGIKSSALRLGMAGKAWVVAFYGLSLTWLFAVLMITHPGILSGIFTLGFMLHAADHLRRWDPGDQGSSLRAFKASRDFGLLVLAACAV